MTGLVLGLFALAPAAGAHTELSSSEPADGAATAGPLNEVVLTFSEPVTLVGFGFEVEDPDGNLLVPDLSSADDTVFTLSFDPPLSGGDVTVRYEVTSADGHVVSGSVSFTVAAETTTMPAASSSTLGTTTVTTSAVSTTVGSATPSTGTSVPEGDGGGDESIALLALGGAVAVGAGTVLVVRTRRNGE